MTDATKLLKNTFGFDAFRPGQEEVIAHLLAGRSAAAVFPTGSGKSICYQLPALLLPGLTLVVSPLIALMKEQTERMRALGVAAASLDSMLSAAESRAVMADLRAGKIRLLYLAPERFNNERTRNALLEQRIALFAVDEAHCISEWGHNFRPDYLKLARFAERCRAERVLALTATATPAVLSDICRGFSIADGCAVRTGFHRPNLALRLTSGGDDREALLETRLIASPAPGPAIVYVTTQKTAERLAGRLAAAGLPARHYHAGMPGDERLATQSWFQAAEQGIVVATIAFGMGIDKANIRAVYHFNLPKSLENYSQEIGRAGRDGQPAHCEMLVSQADLSQLETFVFGDTPDLKAVAGLIDELCCGSDELVLNLTELSQAHDLRPSVLATLLTYLELGGIVEAGTPIYAVYRFQPRAPSAEILAMFAGEEREFLAALLRLSVKARTWFDIDLARAEATTKAPRERIVGALDHLGELGLLDIKAEGVRHRYRRLSVPADTRALARSLHAKLLARESRELARLGQIMELAELDACQTSYLGAHFGEPLAEACGRCSWCVSGGRRLSLPARPTGAIDPAVWDHATKLRAAHPDPLAEPRAFARFLCGMPSPRLGYRRLAAHELFGSMGAVPFQTVLERIERGC